MMRFTLLCLTTLLVSGSHAWFWRRDSAKAKPWFCKGSECPAFTEETRQGFSERIYTSPMTWAATRITSNSSQTQWMTSNSNMMFNKLFRYISGENVNGTKIDMTKPVLTRYEKMETGETEVTMLFYLAGVKPQPTDKDVFLVEVPAGTSMLVGSFRSYLFTRAESWDSAVTSLMTSVQEAGLPYREGVVYHVSYDGPFAFIRHNEVWLDRPTF